MKFKKKKNRKLKKYSTDRRQESVDERLLNCSIFIRCTLMEYCPVFSAPVINPTVSSLFLTHSRQLGSSASSAAS